MLIKTPMSATWINPKKYNYIKVKLNFDIIIYKIISKFI